MGESTATWIEFYDWKTVRQTPGMRGTPTSRPSLGAGLGAYPTDQAGWRSSSTICWKSFDLAAYP
jgi:hypothetical protein